MIDSIITFQMGNNLMQITDKLIRPLTEVKYLNADNVDRYRCIMRIFLKIMRSFITGCTRRKSMLR